ncbi:hypothetical protein B0J14DRAFT_586207 [Halenospora varia]|nr:hypothetical protein B0J14DRAFT_586207 [Halenospora varia]
MADDPTMTPLRRVSLRSFLSSAKSLLANPAQQKEPLTFVVGNESADLDSLTSAIALAYLRTYSSPSSKSARNKGIYIPLSNLQRDDLGLRPELGPVLKQANLSIQDLITLDELPGFSSTKQHGERGKLEPGGTKWVLVDHNVLQGELGKAYGGRVVGVLDHHEDEGKYTDACSGEEGEGRMIKICGSCASLIVSEWESSELSGQSGEEQTWNQELAKLALAPIIIDTSNLQSKQKTTDIDRAAVSFLDSIIQTPRSEVQASEAFDRKAYFGEVSKAKEDIGSLGLKDILRKDYKQWNEAGLELGISSVVKNLDFLIDKVGSEGEFHKVVKAWAEERDLNIVSVMTTSHGEEGFRRELFVVRKFEGESGEKLGLKGWREAVLDAEGEMGYRKCWHQERVECSRKQVAPLLRGAME